MQKSPQILMSLLPLHFVSLQTSQQQVKKRKRKIGIKSECHAQPQKRNGYWNGDVHFTKEGKKNREKKILKCAVVCNDAHWVIHVQNCLMQCHIVRNSKYQMKNHRFTYYTILFFLCKSREIVRHQRIIISNK